MDFQYGCCCPNRLILLMLSSLCTIIVLTEQAVAYVVHSPTPTVSFPHIPSNESLVEILPRDNSSSSSNSKLFVAVKQQRSFNQLVMKGLTPGQQVINAVPDNERDDFIMHQLAVALAKSYDNETRQRYFNKLDDLRQYYGERITVLEKVPIYEHFPTDLLDWVEQEFNLSHQHVYVQLCSRTEIWCTAQGVCYAYGSGVGCYCCPF